MVFSLRAYADYLLTHVTFVVTALVLAFAESFSTRVAEVVLILVYALGLLAVCITCELT